MAFDRHMNVVLSDCEEFRTVKPRSEEAEKEVKRLLGLVLLRGECIVSLFPEAPPVKERSGMMDSAATVGSSQAFNRGSVEQSTAGLTGPVRGVGGGLPGVSRPSNSSRY